MINNLNNKYSLRIDKAKQSINTLLNSEKKNEGIVSEYIETVTNFIDEMFRLESELNEDYFVDHDFEELLELNHGYYNDIEGEAYVDSYANPEKSVSIFGDSIGQVLSSVYEDVRQCVGFAFEHRAVSIMWISELFIGVVTILNKFKDIIESSDLVKNADLLDCHKELIHLLKEHQYVDMEERFELNIYRRFNPEFDIYSKQIVSDSLDDDRYIFKYGMYIGHNEIELINYFKKCEDSKLQDMANTYTEAFHRGFINKRIDLKLKKTVNIGYHIGFERVIKKAVENFKAIGLLPLVYYELKGTKRPRLMNTKPSKQMEYDHRFDDGLTMDQKYSDVLLKLAAKVLEDNRELISYMAGPAIMEIFGETPFAPLSKKTCIKYNDKVKELMSKHNNKYQQLFSKYLPRSNYSFVIISYPVPEIGDQFNEIFDETIKVNTLDEKVYQKIQQCIIEALDKGVSVHVTGRNGNRTDLIVNLNDLLDTSTQTNFNNCTADVNVPVGEVFTSPKLEGTYGKLHVKEVYLHGLKFIDLDIDFKEGMMDSFTCNNFEDEEANVNYILENMTHPHKTLPLGEFAIGTNTTAYVMAKKYNIEKIIPILIGEKMGPHFAVGDTCYTWSEELSIYNPDGREVVARENSKTAKRSSKIEEAYTYCHTDITIPYSELDCISVNLIEGGKLDIIRNGRFVLEGTELLNEPLKDMEV